VYTLAFNGVVAPCGRTPTTVYGSLLRRIGEGVAPEAVAQNCSFGTVRTILVFGEIATQDRLNGQYVEVMRRNAPIAHVFNV